MEGSWTLDLHLIRQKKLEGDHILHNKGLKRGLFLQNNALVKDTPLLNKVMEKNREPHQQGTVKDLFLQKIALLLTVRDL